MTDKLIPDEVFEIGLPTTICRVASGQEGMVLAELAGQAAESKGLLHLCADPQQMTSIADAMAFFAPWLEVLKLPAWDCLPYDRVSPSNHVIAERMAVLARLANRGVGDKPLLVLTTANAVLQKNLPKEHLAGQQQRMVPGNRVDMDAIVGTLSSQGFERVSTVREKGSTLFEGALSICLFRSR